MSRERWTGVDVGGRRKGFHLAVIEGDQVTELDHYPDAQTLAAHLVDLNPGAVGIDSPPEWAPDGQKSRPAEREFARRRICGIRYTPDLATAQAHPGTYYDWIFNGMELWDALRQDPHLHNRLYEVFPTASWTVWHGPRGSRKREEWSHEALLDLPLYLPDVRWTQDLRDAVGAASTVWAATPTVGEDSPIVPPEQLPGRR